MNNVIIHYGIDGQKWGVRHGPPYPLSRQKGKKWTVKTKSGETQNLESKNRSIGKRSKAKIVLENMDDLTVDEIRDLISRIELEEKLSRMSVPEKKEGKDIALKVIGKIGEASVAAFVPLAIGYLWKKAMTDSDN